MMNDSISFRGSLEEHCRQLPQTLSWVRAHLDGVALASLQKMELELALEEALVNIMSHGAKQIPLKIEILCRSTVDVQIEFELRDTGIPFNPLTHSLSIDETLSPEDMPIGGRGLLLMKGCVDALLYRREDEMNILTLIKNLPNQEKKVL